MRTLLRSRYGWVFPAAGALAGLAAWWLGPTATVALVTGIGLTVSLFFGQWLRIRQRWIGNELARLSAHTAHVDQLVSRRDYARWEQDWAQRWDQRWDDGLSRLRRQLSTSENRVLAARRQEVAQLQALQNLYAMVPVRHRMPPLDAGWAVSPDFMLLLVSLMQEHRPGTIVELGSGASTVWMARVLQEHGVDSRIVSVDHDQTFAESTRERLAALGLDKLVELRVAPLVELVLDGESYRWYDPAAFSDVTSCELLVVDGPPGNLRSGSRYPALPVLADRLPPGSRVLLDDYHRPDEHQMVSRWVDQLPGWWVQELPYAKGAALLTRGE